MAVHAAELGYKKGFYRAPNPSLLLLIRPVFIIKSGQAWLSLCVGKKRGIKWTNLSANNNNKKRTVKNRSDMLTEQKETEDRF